MQDILSFLTFLLFAAFPGIAGRAASAECLVVYLLGRDIIAVQQLGNARNGRVL